MYNKRLRSLDNIQALETAHSAPYGAIPYCIMQCSNRLSYMLLYRGGEGGVLGWVWWLTSLSLPSLELSSCWGVNFPHLHINTDLTLHGVKKVNIHITVTRNHYCIQRCVSNDIISISGKSVVFSCLYFISIVFCKHSKVTLWHLMLPLFSSSIFILL